MITADSPQWLRQVPGDLSEFRQLVAEGTIALDGVTGDDLMEYIPAVRSGRTGRYWLEKVRNGNS